jgi:JAB1/Mov34/MPN/PAD-1 ubiquitin protease
VSKPIPVARSILWRPASGGPPSTADLADPLFFGQAALAALYDHLATVAAGAEGGGVLGFLIGDIPEDPENGAPYFVIDACVRFNQAVFGDRTAVVLDRLWDPVQNQLARNNAQLLGWYHSHPPHGIELTPEDVETHQQFFDEPWHVALVLGTLDRAPAAGLFRPGAQSGTDTSLPFYELLQEASVRESSKKRSLVTWKNYRSVDPVAPPPPTPPPPPPAPPKPSAPAERKSGATPEMSLPQLPSLETWHDPSAIPDLPDPPALSPSPLHTEPPAASPPPVSPAPPPRSPPPPPPRPAPPPPPPPPAPPAPPAPRSHEPVASTESDLPFMSTEDAVWEVIEGPPAPPPPPPLPQPTEPRRAKPARKKVKWRRAFRVPRGVRVGAVRALLVLAAAGAYWLFVGLTPAQLAGKITKVAAALGDRAGAFADRAVALADGVAALVVRQVSRVARPAPPVAPPPAPSRRTPAPAPGPPSAQPPQPQPTQPAPVQPAPQKTKLELAADSVTRAVRAYHQQSDLFAQQRLDCAALARWLAAVERRWISYSVDLRAVRVPLDATRAAAERALYASVDSVERRFDRTGCQRP